MKIMFRLPRNLRKSIILALLFSIIFPWTLMAEASQQAPKNSLSYFLENEETAKKADSQPQNSQAPQIVKTPETISAEPQSLPGFEVAPPEPAPEEKIDRTAAIEAIRARLASMETQNQPQAKNQEPTIKETAEPAKIEDNKPEAAPRKEVAPVAPVSEAGEKAVPTAPKTSETLITEKATSPAPEEKQIQTPATGTETLAAADEYVPFAGVLARMQQNKAKRTAEAQKLGVVLPSQGGDIATVSPSLSKMHQAIRDIMNR